MSLSRRKFLHGMLSVPALAAAQLRHTRLLSLLLARAEPRFRPNLLPTQQEVWAWQVWMAKLGPKFTGNPAHRTFVEFLASHLQSIGLEVVRDSYTLPRWDARRWEISVSPSRGHHFTIPVTSYFPYSGQTPPTGVTGELAYVGRAPSAQLSGLQGKIAFADCPVPPRPYAEWYTPWGLFPRDMTFPAAINHSGANQFVGGLGGITEFQKAGARAVILGWTDVSDANAAYQYTPFSRPLQNIPGLWVGREAGDKLRGLARGGAKSTLTLEADLIPDSPTDTLLATLPGVRSDEIIIINTHTDGTNATEENGGLGLLALARYLKHIPKAQRRRTLVFIFATGHFAGAYVPSIRGVIEKHPDLIKKTVAALTVEHLGAMEWMDNSSLHYVPTGKHELSLAISPFEAPARVMLEALQGSRDNRTAVVKLATPRSPFFGEVGPLYRAGVPTIGHIPIPNYLLAAPPNGDIEKPNPELIYSQIQVFAKVIHGMDTITRDQLRGS
jgi:hypothetical protein